MKTLFLFIGLSFACLGCKDESASRREQSPTRDKSAEIAVTEAPSTLASSKATPEQVASTVRVRVVAGGLPPKSHTGALLHRDELSAIPGMQGTNRCVLALLGGWTEAQLRNPACRIFIDRNQPDAKGAPRTRSTVARLLQLNEQTGLAAVAYTEKFDSTLDAGFHLDQQATLPDRAQVLRSASNANEAPSLEIEVGSLSGRKDQRGKVQFPPAKDDSLPDESPAVVTGQGRLIGFLRDLDGDSTAIVVPVGEFRLNLKVPILKPVGVGFGKIQGQEVPISITTEHEDPALVPRRVTLRFVESPDLKASEETAGKANGPIENAKVDVLSPKMGNEWRGKLPAPGDDGREVRYVVQLGWPAIPTQFNESVFSRSFVVRLMNKGGEAIGTVEGLTNLNAARTANQGPVTPFPLEAAVADFHEMAGGREVLMRMDGPPFWKRFSLTRNEWLPMPAINLSNASLTGNLTALFVFDRGAAEVRKYRLSDLTLLAAVKLSPGDQYVAILAGCNSDRAPLHILSKKDVMSLSAETLQKLEFRSGSRPFIPRLTIPVSAEASFHVSGDGLGFLPHSVGGTNHNHAFYYSADAFGAVPQYFFGASTWITAECGAGVSAAYSMWRGEWLQTVITTDGATATPKSRGKRSGSSAQWLAPNSPVIFRYVSADENAIPANPGRIECFAYSNSVPFAEVEVPELSGNDRGYLDRQQRGRWLAFDPYSLRLGVLGQDRKTWVVHQIVAGNERSQPVLLNWPETSLVRGEEFRFKPLMLGGADFSAETLGSKSPVIPKVADGEVSFPVPADEFASLQLMNLKIPGKDTQLTYAIPLHVFGPQFPVVAPRDATPESIDQLGRSFKFLLAPKERLRALASSTHTFPDPVRQVLGPIAGHLILVTEAQRIDFFSLETRKVSASVPAPAQAAYYAGAGALFEYDAATRTLARLSVPDARRELSMTLPAGLRLHALGVGTLAASPLTLLLEQLQGQTSQPLGNFTLTETRFDRNVVILDSRTLQAGAWGQLKMWPPPGPGAGNPFNYGSLQEMPKPLATSHDGCFVTLPRSFLALGRDYTFAASFPEGAMPWQLDMGRYPPSGSISGTIVANSMGTSFNGGVSDEFSQTHPNSHVTPCGRYRLVNPPASSGEGAGIEVRTVENNRELFRMGRPEFDHQDFDGYDKVKTQTIARRLTVLADDGPLVVLALGGRLLQIVSFDIPRIAQQLAPNEFHVTSQPPAWVMAGSRLEYQIAVNNPPAVAGFQLRDLAAGASLSSEGRLVYLAPQVTQPTRMQIPVEIRGKDGQTVIHTSTFFVLPRVPAKPAPPATPRPRPDSI